MAIIETRDLRKTFTVGDRKARRTVEAVAGVDITIDAGERIAFIGPNGAGKSTSIKMLTGILSPTSGDAFVLGLVPWRDRRKLARHIGVLFGQRSQLWSELTARRSLSLLGAIYGLDRATTEKRTESVAALLDASELLDQPVRSFSLGQRMRCELAATMLHEPEVLFLDEPTIGLDLVAKQTFRDLIARLNEESNTTIFLTSHDVADIEAVAERVIIVNHGKVIFDDPVSVLRSSVLATKLIEVHFEIDTTLLPMAGVEVLSSSRVDCSIRVDTRQCSVREVLDNILESYAVADISVMDPPLEDIIAGIYTAGLK